MIEPEKTVRIILASVLGVPQDIDINDDLLEHGMDSLNCLKVVVAIEDEFEIIFPEEKINLKSLRRIKNICETVEVCLNGEHR